MPLRSVSAAYLVQARDLVGNPGQQAAYESTGHCVVLAGPGSGKTKTLVLKLARIMAEDVRVPRGAACITYSQECARELTRRLERLGLREATNLFVGTVHGFCLRHLLMPYGRLADLPVPFPLTVATQQQSSQLLEQVGDRLFGVKHPNKPMDLGRHRRSILDRGTAIWRSEEELAAWTEGYEAELRRAGLIDFDDLVIFGQRVVSEFDWVLPLLQSKFPVLAVDEYQDLGVALHRIVKRMAFDGGVRLFAVGERVLARRDRSGHRITTRTTFAEFPVYDAIDANRRLRTTHEPGKRVSVAFVLRDLDDLVDDFEVRDTINEALAAIYESIYKLDLPVCTATVVLRAELLESEGSYGQPIYVMGPLFGTVLTARRAAYAPWRGYGPGAPPFWTPLFIRKGFNIKQLLGYVPQWDRPREGYPCPSDE